MFHVDARSIVGVFGNVVTFGLFLCPILTMMKIWKAKSVQGFSSIPYVVTLLNCGLWVLYGHPSIHKHNILVLIINAIGLGLELIYIGVFLWYSNKPKRLQILGYLVAEAIIFSAVLSVALKAFHTEKKRTLFVGIFCLVLNIGMYSSPLTIMYHVVKTKSVEFMPFWLSFFSACNGGIWLVYALLRFDLFIVIPNGSGMVLGIVQLILYGIYRKKSGSGKVKSSKEVQLALP